MKGTIYDNVMPKCLDKGQQYGSSETFRDSFESDEEKDGLLMAIFDGAEVYDAVVLLFKTDFIDEGVSPLIITAYEIFSNKEEIYFLCV